jgi:PIN domain nuclease of toxin-antitoxin system
VKLLLDTHVWVWSHLDPGRVSRVRSALVAPANELWLSPISVWEFLLLVERGRIVVRGEAGQWIRTALERAPMHEATLNHEVALLSRSLALPHQDPADRFLAASAAVHDLVLVTEDARLLAGKGYRTLASR